MFAAMYTVGMRSGSGNFALLTKSFRHPPQVEATQGEGCRILVTLMAIMMVSVLFLLAKLDGEKYDKVGHQVG